MSKPDYKAQINELETALWQLHESIWNTPEHNEARARYDKARAEYGAFREKAVATVAPQVKELEEKIAALKEERKKAKAFKGLDPAQYGPFLQKAYADLFGQNPYSTCHKHKHLVWVSEDEAYFLIRIDGHYFRGGVTRSYAGVCYELYRADMVGRELDSGLLRSYEKRMYRKDWEQVKSLARDKVRPIR